MFKQLPKWVKDYPSEIDKSALIMVAKSSKGLLEKPREMNFAVYGISNQRILNDVKEEIQDHGWVTTVQAQSDNKNLFLIEAKKDNYIINQENYERDTLYFMRLAKRYEIGYDGWYASN